MAKHPDDWETLMNRTFGGSRTGRTGSGDFDASELSRRLQENQAFLDRELRRQTEQLRQMEADRPTRIPDFTPPARPSADATLADSRRMLQELEADGLLAAGTAAVPTEHRGSFTGLADKVKKTVLGQDAFVDSIVRAMRRPFVMGSTGGRARNVILITGADGTGRHFTLNTVVAEMAARGLLSSDKISTVDLALYPSATSDKLFLQDLYAALHASAEIIVFENYAQCHPGYLRTLAELCIKGSAPLNSRYVLKDGILVDAGTALVPGAVSTLNAGDKYLIFFSNKGKTAIADKFGSAMVNAIGDECSTAAFAPQALTALAARQLNELAQRVRRNLNLTLQADAAVRDELAKAGSTPGAADTMVDSVDALYRALCEYCLTQDEIAPDTAVKLTAPAGEILYAVGDAQPAPLLALLPGEYKGHRTAVQEEMDNIVGLAPVKQFVLDLADNVQIRQRRRAQGLKADSVSMHMIFTGNPGTGKTTIARVVSRYLKAIGALRGGQLVEVSRGDLVGRYSGHTAPLTNSVIQSALGGVLFIDEAYSLYRGEQDSFGLEAIDTLVKGIEDHRDDLVVILAGYTREMSEFLASNSGLASRFNHTIEFPDYTAQELLAITKLQARGKGYTLADTCDDPLLAYYALKQDDPETARTAGNGRLARNTLEKAILNQSRRLVAEPDAPLELLLPTDFELED